MFGRKPPAQHVPARVRAYGRARIEIAQRAQTRQDWDSLWKPPQQTFPFDWGEPWKQCIEYKVDDFAAEVGFYIDVLGLPVNAFNADYAMFTSPNHDFYFAVVQATEGAHSTPPDALRLQFMVGDIFSTTQELIRRGIHLEQEARPIFEGSQQWVAIFHTPHGISLEIWGLVEMVSAEPAEQPPAKEQLRVPVPIPEVSGVSPFEANPYDPDAEESHGEVVEEQADEPELESYVPRWNLDQEESQSEETQLTPSRHFQPEEYPSPEYTQPEDSPFTESAPSSPSFRQASPTPAPVVHSFSNGEAMLEHLKQKKSQSQFSQAARQPEKPSTSLQGITKPQPNTLNFRPAPKATSEEPSDSIWDSVDQDAEYIDGNEENPSEDYHYKPIQLNRKI